MNQIKTKKIFPPVFLTVFLIFPLILAKAQSRQLQEDRFEQNANISSENSNFPQDNNRLKVLADTTISNAQIVSQNNNNFEIAFALINKKNTQTGIKYAVKLQKQEDDQNNPYYLDSHVFKEALTLEENQTVTKKVNYVAPPFLSGDFAISIEIINSQGLKLASSYLGQVTLNGSNQYIEIIPSNCQLLMQDNQYPLDQIIGVKEQQDFSLQCEIENKTQRSITYKPEFSFRAKSKVGELIKNKKAEFQTRTIEPQTVEEISIQVPKISAPRNYFVEFNLKELEKPVSNKVFFRYKAEGVGAVIETLELDKNYYKKGEEINVKLLWDKETVSSNKRSVEAVDTSQDYGFKLMLEVINDQGKACFNSGFQQINNRRFTFSQTSQVDCFDPTIRAAILNSDGEALDSKVVEMGSKDQKEIKGKSKIQETKSLVTIIIKIFIALAVLILSIIIIIMLAKKINKKK
ncbi:MAG: hypothetical protein GF335_01985 [Candidatus Moranbacteria bacterium]|nr:hypothetical protein [Candidatus Moranbacteria bacterium]